jgi:hypothetical protein
MKYNPQGTIQKLKNLKGKIEETKNPHTKSNEGIYNCPSNITNGTEKNDVIL